MKDICCIYHLVSLASFLIIFLIFKGDNLVGGFVGSIHEYLLKEKKKKKDESNLDMLVNHFFLSNPSNFPQL